MLTAEEMFPEKARHRELVGLLTQIRDRLPDPDADTVTLRREDMEVVLEHGALSPTQPTRPRVHASVEWESEELRDGGYNVVRHPPGVSVSVDFDLHDHERALKYLEAAARNVAAQIEETR